jgi:cystathionine beta-lyase/cystathionine gamma-synthase
MRPRHGISTRAIHAGAREGDDVIAPLARSVIQRFDTAERFGRVMAEEEAGFLYSRLGNATTADTAAAIAALEGAEAAVLTASGMAAVHAAVLALAPGGSRVVVALSAYGNTVSLLRDYGERLGLDVALVDTRDLDAVRAACAGGIAILLCETIANPGSVVADLDALAAIAHDAGGRLVVDSTVATPVLCRPLEHGADVVLHSATKFLNGHHDVLAGAICGPAEDLARIRAFLIDTGGVAEPDTAWLLRRGMRTLALRMERACANALAVARHLQARDDVVAVPYPGLPEHPQHALASRLLDGGFGALLAVEVRGGRAGGERVMNGCLLWERATSLGGVTSGISHPASTSHRQLSEDELAAVGIPPGLLRLAVGCEDAADLVADLDQALDGAGEGAAAAHVMRLA